jgi:AraC-like DNA-binding protein
VHTAGQQRADQSGSSDVEEQRFSVETKLPGGDVGDLGRMVWVTHPSTSLAVDIVKKLRSVNVDAKLWDECHAPGRGPSVNDFVVANPTGLNMIAQCMIRSRATGNLGAPKAGRGGLAPRVLGRVVEHMEMRLSERLETAALAAIAGLSDGHFSRAFRQSLGMPPHRYLMTRRIAVGAGLIERTDRTFTDIALSVGFSSHSHFARLFVRMIGETPRAYRGRKQQARCA